MPKVDAPVEGTATRRGARPNLSYRRGTGLATT